jgi:hypothetical protein
MLRRRFALLVVVAAGAMTMANACSDDLDANPTGPDSGGPPGTLGDSVCPDAAPEAGEGCLLPEGTTCAFGACGSSIARCATNAWRYAGNPAPRPPCPTDFPASESACPPCWPAEVSCTYGSSDCSKPDASTNTTVASCPNGRWTTQSFPCAVSDAGADVQGDAGPDAD